MDHVCRACLDKHYWYAKKEQVKNLPETTEMVAWENATDEERERAWFAEEEAS